MSDTKQHPIGLYFKVWGLLFVLSAFSYAVDYLHVQGPMRWVLVLSFMAIKAGLIIAVFMHMAWERLSLVYAIILPILAVLVFVGIMVSESDYTFLTRSEFFSALEFAPGPVEH